MNVRRSGSDLWLLAVVTILWLALGAYIAIRVGDETFKLVLIGCGWALGCLAIMQNTRLRVWTHGSVLFVRNGWFKRRFRPDDVRAFVTRSYAGGHWLVEMETTRGLVSMHATDRRVHADVESIAHMLQQWLVSPTPAPARRRVSR